MAIGLPLETASFEQSLASLVNKTSTYEKLHSVIVVILLNQGDEGTAQRTLVDGWVKFILRHFNFELNIGYIHIFQQPRTKSRGHLGGAALHLEAMRFA